MAHTSHTELIRDQMRGLPTPAAAIKPIAGAAAASADTPPCAARPGDWDLEIPTKDFRRMQAVAEKWRAALSACHSRCPMLERCQEQASREQPRDMIWAGIAYGSTGQPIARLETYILRKIAVIRRSRT
ncbi:hypothetical protein ACIBCD_25160 [Nocardia brasiliensis]|uniref:hypothetical protein n=2 Tax=Nocardia brasiliensis TaxID=37326 RepID=UPI000E06B8AA|nr:hypothetical protein [Nocardia brasiliensis]SUB41365.1 Uncharacterised protein [Nocardia brasiliensis]